MSLVESIYSTLMLYAIRIYLINRNVVINCINYTEYPSVVRVNIALTHFWMLTPANMLACNMSQVESSYCPDIVYDAFSR